MPDLTPETLAELRRLLAAVDGLHGTPRRGGKTYARETLAVAAVNALPALLDAAARLAEAEAERDEIAGRLAHLLCDLTGGRLSRTTYPVPVMVQEIEQYLSECHESDLKDERDELAAKVERLTGTLIDAGYRAAEDRADAGALRAMLAGRCLSDITHRDDEHRQSVCMLPAEHAPLAHDDCMGCTWTDADHWQPSAVDRVADEVQRIAAESQREGWDGPLVRIFVGRISAALEGES